MKSPPFNNITTHFSAFFNDILHIFPHFFTMFCTFFLIFSKMFVREYDINYSKLRQSAIRKECGIDA